MASAWMVVLVIVGYQGERSIVENLDIRVKRVEERAVVIKTMGMGSTRLEAIGGLRRSNEYLGDTHGSLAKMLEFTGSCTQAWAVRYLVG